MATEPTVVIPESLKNVSEDVLRQALKMRTAEERMAELRKNLSAFHTQVNGANTVEETYRLCAGFVSKVNNARQVLGTTKKADSKKKHSK